MNPYRDRTRVWVPKARKPKLNTDGMAIAVLFVSLCTGAKLSELDPRFLLVAAFGLIVSIAMFIVGQRGHNALTRLCRLLWHRGDKLGAVWMFFGLMKPIYSKRRIARNSAAYAARRRTV